MDKFIIKGGNKLSGQVEISGAKNSALALIPATLLTNGKNVISNIPIVNDIFTITKLLNQLGVVSELNGNELSLDTSVITSQTAPYELVKKMRASIYVLGPLLAKYGYANVSLPGGCAWGPRPVNLHIEAMKKLGASIDVENGNIIAKANKLIGTSLNFDISSVGATGNALMACVLAKGESLITNAAIEPEITQLAEYLVSMGAKIEGIGTPILHIQGVDDLTPANIYNISDRIEAGTLLLAGAITKSKIEILYRNSDHIGILLNKIEKTGTKLDIKKESIIIDATDTEIQSVDITTAIYPGFPTDMQAQWMAYMCLANGTSRISEGIYADRFTHHYELNRLGADITLVDNTAIVKGVKKLNAAKVMSTDLRASASLVLGGLIADGATEVLRVYHIDRGYQKIEEKLKKLGADIERVAGSEF